MNTEKMQVAITTDASGDRVITTPSLFGYVESVELVLGTSTSLDLTLEMKNESGDLEIYADTGLSSSVRARPTQNFKFAGERVEVTVANGGNAKTATVYVHLSDTPLTEVTLAGDLEIGAVEIKDATGTARAKVAAGNTLDATDSALAVADVNAVPLATANNPGTKTNVTNASETLFAINAARRSATIQNMSTTAMLSVQLGATAVSGQGINLAPAADATHPGGSVTIDDYTGVIDGIMSVADATAGNVALGEV